MSLLTHTNSTVRAFPTDLQFHLSHSSMVYKYIGLVRTENTQNEYVSIKLLTRPSSRQILVIIAGVDRSFTVKVYDLGIPTSYEVSFQKTQNFNFSFLYQSESPSVKVPLIHGLVNNQGNSGFGKFYLLLRVLLSLKLLYFLRNLLFFFFFFFFFFNFFLFLKFK